MDVITVLLSVFLLHLQNNAPTDRRSGGERPSAPDRGGHPLESSSDGSSLAPVSGLHPESPHHSHWETPSSGPGHCNYARSQG